MLGLIFFPQRVAVENELMRKAEISMSRIRNVGWRGRERDANL